jgi:hypothetical protein
MAHISGSDLADKPSGATLPEELRADAQLAEHANEIRRLGKRAIGDIIEIGRHLIEAKKLAGHGNWLPWLDREFGWKEQSARNFVNVAELAAKSPTVGDLNIDFRGLYLLSAPSTPVEVVEEVAALGRKVTLEDVARATSAHKTADDVRKRRHAPAPPNLKLVAKPTPERGQIEILRDRIDDQFADRKFRSANIIGAALQVAKTAVREALKTAEEGRVVQHKNPAGEIEYAISPTEVVDLRALLAIKDEKIAELEARIAAQDVEIEQLTELLTAPSPAMVH